MSVAEALSLEGAKAQILESSDDTAVEQALAVVADASANIESRSFLQDESFFTRLLALFDHYGEKPPVTLLRPIGNLLADNERNRGAFVCRPDCINRLRGFLSRRPSSDKDGVFEDFAVKILYNLCNDSPESQKKTFEQGVHVAIIDHLTVKQFKEEDEALLALEASLLASLVESGEGIKLPGGNTKEYIQKILTLPFLQPQDSETLLDLLSVVLVALQDEDFVLQTVQHKQIHLIWQVLELVDEISRSGEVDEEDERQYRQYLNALAQSLADVSSLPAFNDQYTLDDDFIVEMCRQCIPSGPEEGRQASILPGCACLMLGNLAVSDDITIAMPERISVDQLLQRLGSSNESVFQNAAAGLLRHIAIPLENRRRCFGLPEHLNFVAHLYMGSTLEQIQVGGLQLTRQMLKDMPEGVQRLVSGQELAGCPTLSTFLTVFHDTTNPQIKVEVARLIASFLRTLHAPSVSENAKSALETLVGTPDILGPFIFTIKQATSPSLMQAQADAWLGLNLYVRTSGGAGHLGGLMVDDMEMISLLRQRVMPKGEEATGAVRESEGDSSGADKANRPSWVEDKERDNTILLIYDILKADEVSEDIKEKLRPLLRESEIRV
ncbi:hypothetical protein AAFC00_005960 [Neodothiora populina]|uniref:Uncharacterized protein n=1 Tax=Neodothiora populina TaxID=2781224 RepID=A0ABR3P6T0_9PEZI